MQRRWHQRRVRASLSSVMHSCCSSTSCSSMCAATATAGCKRHAHAALTAGEGARQAAPRRRRCAHRARCGSAVRGRKSLGTTSGASAPCASVIAPAIQHVAEVHARQPRVSGPMRMHDAAGAVKTQGSSYRNEGRIVDGRSSSHRAGMPRGASAATGMQQAHTGTHTPAAHRADLRSAAESLPCPTGWPALWPYRPAA